MMHISGFSKEAHFSMSAVSHDLKVLQTPPFLSEVAIVLTSLFGLVLTPQFDGWPVAYCVDSINV